MKLLDVEVGVGKPSAIGELSVFPILAGAISGSLVVAGGPALEAGVLAVDELATPTVPELRITNNGASPVLLVEGELLLGAAQDRTLNVDVLLASGAETTVPVSCVEAGRWGGMRRKVVASRAHAGASLRASKIAAMERDDTSRSRRSADQGLVWRQVDAYSAQRDVDSPTAALEDVNARVAADLERSLDALERVDGQLGVAVGHRGEVVGVELFGSGELFEANFRKIVLGYALETGGAKPIPTPIDAVESFLEVVNEAEAVRQPGIGLGDEIHLHSERVVGVGLRFEGELLHLVAFPVPV